MEQEPDKQENNRNPDGTFKKGFSGNPNGRPLGKTLKEWAREQLALMNEEERNEFVKGLPKEIIWKMAEGNPQTDVTSGGKEIPQPIINVISTNNSDKQDSGNEAKNPDSARGDERKQDNINPPIFDSNGTVGQGANPNINSI